MVNDRESSEPGRLLSRARSGIVETAGDGYEFMAANERVGWRALPDWGADGWDLGRWPTSVVLVSDEYDLPRVAVYLEGDVETREFSSQAERDYYIDDTAEYLWRSGEAAGPRDIASYPPGELPDAYRGHVTAPAAAATPPIASALSQTAHSQPPGAPNRPVTSIS